MHGNLFIKSKTSYELKSENIIRKCRVERINSIDIIFRVADPHILRKG